MASRPAAAPDDRTRGDVVGKLDVNLPDLSQAADNYAELQIKL